MLSSDKNVETVSQLIEMVKHNLELRKEYAKLDMVDKVVRLLSAATLAFILIIITSAILLFLSASVASWLHTAIGLSVPMALLAMAGFYLLLLLVVYASRKSWIERPLVKYLSKLLLN